MARWAAFSTGDRGFVLLLVLALTSVIAASAIALLQIGYNDRISIRGAVANAQSGLALDAALTRAAQALADPADKMRRSLLSGIGPTPWTFAGSQIAIEAIAESGKIDVNTSDSELRQMGFRLARLAGIEITNRLGSGPQSSVDALLRPCDRASWKADRLREIFTVYTRQYGITVHLASLPLLESLRVFSRAEIDAIREYRSDPNTLYRGPYLESKARIVSHGPSVYTIRATIKRGHDFQTSKERVVMLSNDAPYVRTIEARAAHTGRGGSLCD